MRKGKFILVTGGAGFIGSHLCEALIAAGHNVACLDSMQTGTIANLSRIIEHPRFQLIERDVVDPIKAMDRADEIYNLACAASPHHYQRDPVHTFKTSVLGALNVLELARKTGARVLQASTSEVYGDPGVHPQPESYSGNVNPAGPRACYDEGKRAAETLFFDYHRAYGVKIKVARIFNTYGPRMLPNDGRIISNFVVQALTGEPITVYGDGCQTRSFCYVDDMVQALVALMNSPDDVLGPINLGNPEELPVLAVARRIVEKTKSSSRIQFKPLPVDDPRRRRPVIERAEKLIGWTPTTGFEGGLQRTIDHFVKVLENPGVVVVPGSRPSKVQAKTPAMNGVAAQ